MKMRLKDFELEVYFDKYEFTAPYLLSQSDCQSMAIGELLALEPGAQENLMKTWLGYSEVRGNPGLRQEIAGLYDRLTAENILVHAGAQEPIFNFMNVALSPGDHVVCMVPTYQSLFEVAGAIGCQVARWELAQGESGWLLDLDALGKLITPKTRAIVLNSPNNPTGYTLSREEMQAVTAIARRHGLYVFSDEVYKDLELDGQQRPWFADMYENAVSLGVMSKAYGLAGLRIGWIATPNRQLYEKMARFKHYTTICSSSPSEYLALVALRNRDKILSRNRAIIRENLDLAEAFFARHPHFFLNNRPMGGPIAFHQLKIKEPVADFCEALVARKGVLLLPSTVYSFPGPYIRMGYGRKNFPACLEKLEEYLREDYRP
ncbi:MAG TPA: aminotransferase class I/II-fold pyridoxal phosphate-dependent enzyme [Selenomonadales bacterium]|nr:aminotransferase class I/II-fold pyridoxal phosphate-dependent enzyme [Selenomonadales bacterium]